MTRPAPVTGPVLRRVGVLAVVAAGALALAWVRSVQAPPLPAAWFLCALALLAVGELRVLTARVSQEQVSVNLVEFAALICLTLVPGPSVVLAGALATALHSLVRHKPPVKAVFAVSLTAAGLGLARALAGPLPSLTAGFTPAADGRLALAVLAYGVGSILATSVVVAAAQQVPVLRALRGLGGFHALVVLANVAAGLGVLLMAQWSPRTMIVVPPLVVAIYLTYLLYLRTGEDRDTWRRLEEAGLALSVLSVAEVAVEAVRHGTSLFDADGVELSLDAAGSSPARWWSTGSGAGAVAAGVGPTRWSASLALVDARDGVAVLGLDLDGERRTAVVGDLGGPRGLLGRIAVTYDGPVRLRARQRQVLTTYARSVASALERAALHEEVVTQAARSAHEASHDNLTGLANRALLHRGVEAALAGAADTGGACGLLLLDLDEFKSVNDTLGHSTGDRLLQVVAGRVAGAVGRGDLVARLGGDEFAVLLPELASPADAERVAGVLLRVLAEPVHLDGLRLAVGASIGVAVCPDDATTAEELFQRADVALYQAKGTRGAVRRYNSDRDSSSVSRLELVAELTSALADDQLVVHYQPQVDVALGTLTGVEALVRWQHPVRGLLLPGEFIEAVEHSGLLQAMTLRVLDTAVRDCAAWVREGRALTVAVNLSARNLLDRTLPDDVAAVLSRHGLAAEALVLEITETAMLGELDVVEEVLSRLRALGVQLSVDDFGTGYSSLAFLQRIQVNEIKVDRGFVQGLLRSEGDAALVRACLDLARSFSARVVAEGVESAALLVALRDLGCDVAQGWHLGRPADLEATRALLGLAPRHLAAGAGRPFPSQRGPLPSLDRGHR